MHSMTGFGQAAGENERFRLRVTLRGVNHRFLDLSLRCDEACRSSESALRELLQSRLQRGRIEVRVVVKNLDEGEPRIVFRKEVFEAIREVAVEAGLNAEALAFSDLLRLPGVFELSFAAVDWSSADEELLLETARVALDQLLSARREEGQRLQIILQGHVDRLREIVGRMQESRDRWEGGFRESLRARMAELLGESGDPVRIAQEAAFLAEKSDVREELDRLQAHRAQFSELLEAEDAQGKRLDFLTQELLREVNTLGAKARQVEMTRHVLDAKMICEQIREQLQNVE